MDRKFIRIYSGCIYDEYLQDFIQELTEKLKRAPEEYRDDVEIDFSGNADDGIEYEVYYWRDKTPEEIQQEKELIETAIRERELIELARLKAKYEQT